MSFSERIQEMIAAVERGDATAVAACFTPDGVYHDVFYGDFQGDGIADMILFDAKPPKGASRPGGWGATYDYALLKTLNITTPWLLSGGLDAANVRAAVKASGATAVDVSSGIESVPGEKSAAKMADFAKALNG